MARSASRKFPLTQHKTGQWCKRIRGKLYYFGSDKQAAYDRYLREAANLHAGKPRSSSVNHGGMTVKELANHYLSFQFERTKLGELTLIHFKDCQGILRAFVDGVGKDVAVDEVTADMLHRHRSHLVKRYAPSTTNRHIAVIKAAFSHGLDFELIDHAPNLRKALPKVSLKQMRAFAATKRRVNGNRAFSVKEVRRILDVSSGQLKAMALLGINCGFGNTDCSELHRADLDLRRGVIDCHRTKTGVKRVTPLWPETVEALKGVLRDRPRARNSGEEGRVFLTRFGRPWIRVDANNNEGTDITKNDEIAKQFNKLLTKLGMKRLGVGFYALRHSFRTCADEVHDQHAVFRIMGHSLPAMADTYVQDIGLDRLHTVVEHVRRKLFSQ